MTRYEQGFMNKCAEYGVNGQILLKELRKSASLVSPIKRLAVKLHPKVDPGKLNWFTRPFTTTKRVPYKVIGSTTVNELAGEGLPYGAGGVADDILSSARGIRETTRLSPEKILAALGLTGAAGIGAYKGLSGGSDAPASIDKGLLMKLLAGTAAVGAGGAIASKAIGKSRKDDEDDEKKKKKSGNR